jgi:hypothetical protein
VPNWASCPRSSDRNCAPRRPRGTCRCSASPAPAARASRP